MDYSAGFCSFPYGLFIFSYWNLLNFVAALVFVVDCGAGDFLVNLRTIFGCCVLERHFWILLEVLVTFLMVMNVALAEGVGFVV